jgi:hypothetical protein
MSLLQNQKGYRQCMHTEMVSLRSESICPPIDVGIIIWAMS